MAKRYFKKQSRIKKSDLIPQGMHRMKGLGHNTFPILKSPINTKEAQRLVHISSHAMEDPSVLVRDILRDDESSKKLDEIIPDEDE